MYCNNCGTEVQDQTLSGAFCPNCVDWLGTNEFSYNKPSINTYIVEVPFSGYSRGNKIFHVDATSEDSAVHKVKNYNAGNLISEEIVRDDRTEDRQYATCNGLVNSEPVLKREHFPYLKEYEIAIYSAELLAESYTLEGLNNLLKKDSRNKIYKHAIYLKSKESKWYEDKNNFPCMLIANLDGGDALVWVHYQIDGIAYDVRDNGHRLVGPTNWRRATKQEILDNIKGL